MSSHCLKCRKEDREQNPYVIKKNKGRITLLSKCAVCNSKNKRIIKNTRIRRIIK